MHRDALDRYTILAQRLVDIGFEDVVFDEQLFEPRRQRNFGSGRQGSLVGDGVRIDFDTRHLAARPGSCRDLGGVTNSVELFLAVAGLAVGADDIKKAVGKSDTFAVELQGLSTQGIVDQRYRFAGHELAIPQDHHLGIL